MAQACHVEIIVLVGGLVTLLHFLEELGWKKKGGRKHESFFGFGLLKTGFVSMGDDRQERAGPEKKTKLLFL